ncbi:MAG: hypothetical protein ACP5KA_07075, partial [Desulfurococcaceae archaeon]
VYGDGLRNKLRGVDVELEFLTLREFFEKEVISTINEWKERQVKGKFSKAKRITLPGNLWLLNLVDFMKSANLVKV